MSTIKLKRSAVQGKVPGVGDLDLGEIALNTFDGKAYMKKDNGAQSIVEIGGGSSGNSAVNNFISVDEFGGDGSTTQFNINTEPFDENHIMVYINGVHQFTNTYSLSGTTVTLDAAPANNDLIEIRTFASVFTGENVTANNVGLSTTANNQIADTFDKNSYRTAKYIIQASSSSQYHSTEVLLLHDDTTVYITEYGTIVSNSNIITVDAEVSGNNINLLVTPTVSNINIKTLRLSVGV